MTQEIEIFYEKDSIVLSHFWKSFFEACGILVSEEKIKLPDPSLWDSIIPKRLDNVLKLKNKKIPKLIILGCVHYEELLLEEENIFYITENNANFHNDRKDILVIKQGGIPLSLFEKKEVIRYLFKDEKEFKTIETLLQIYNDNNIWAISWLFSQFKLSLEFDFEEKIFDAEIREACLNTFKAIKKCNSSEWNIKYFEMYIKYIFITVNTDSFSGRIEIVGDLLEDLEQFAKIKGYTPSLFYLAGKIIELSPIERKVAIRFYSKLLEYKATPDILYNIGLIFEDSVLEEKAMKLYEKALDVDSNHYLSLFKVAFNLQKYGYWKKTLDYYEKIIKLIKKENIYVSINPIKCLYGTYKRRLKTVYDYFSYGELINNQINVINNFTSNNEIYDKLDPLLLNMFGEDMFMERKNSIINEINKKLLD